MLNTKFLVALSGIMLAVLAICKTDFNEPVLENFWATSGVNFTVKKEKVITDKEGRPCSELPQNFNLENMPSSGFFSSPNFQQTPSLRSSSVGQGSSIRLKPTSQQNLGTQSQGLNQTTNDRVQKMANMVKENYSSCGKPSVSLGDLDYNLPSGYANGDFNQKYQDLDGLKLAKPCDDADVNGLPVGTMNMMDPDGDMQQVIVYDRQMYSLGKSRLRALGDHIRGDLPIVPSNSYGWFAVSANPHTDLNQGALNVIAEPTSNADLLALQMQSRAGTTFGGMDHSQVCHDSEIEKQQGHLQRAQTHLANNTDISYMNDN